MANLDVRGRGLALTVLQFGLLAVAEWIFFFRNAGHFFNGDSLFWLWNRYHTFSEFLIGFTRVDPALWFRPLAERTVESLLFPIAGLNPVPYRLVGFLLFFSCTVSLYFLAERVTANRRAAWFAVVLFAPHLVHAFITYDVAFTPDLVLMLFSIGAAAAYTSFLRTQKRTALILTMLCVVGSLLSKEAAAGLPLTLFAIWLLLPRESRGTPYSFLAAFLILTIYLGLVLGFLHVRNLEIGHILGQLPQDPTSDYRYGGVGSVSRNIVAAFTWAFGIPAGIHGGWFFGSDRLLAVLKTIRVLATVGALAVFFTKQRRVVLLGMLWFVTMLAPALLLETHFLPYYLFTPLAGLALAGGVVLDWFYLQLRRIHPQVAMAIAAVILAGWTKAHINAANRLVLTHSLLGASSRQAALALEDVRRTYPALPKGATLVFLHENVPATFGAHGKGKLFNLAYNDPTLVVAYYQSGLPRNIDAGDVFTFQWEDGHFVDVTPLMRQAGSALR